MIENGTARWGKGIFFAFLLFIAWPVLAGAEDLQLNPQVLLVNQAGGSDYQGKVTVQNHADQMLRLRVEPEYWQATGFHAPLEAWLKFSSQILEVPAHSSQTLGVKFSVPQNLRGDCLVMVFLANENSGSVIKLVTRIGFPLYICRQGTEVITAEVKSFRLLPGTATERAFEVEVKNTGNVHVVPFGVIQLKRNGQVLKSLEVNFSQPVFPGNSERKEIRFSAPKTPGGPCQAELNIFLDTQYHWNSKPELKTVKAQCAISL